MRAPDLRAIGSSKLPPDAGGLVDALKRLGYDFPQAVADLIDNSVDAHASNVLIRFFRTAGQLHAVAVADDGSGMTRKRLDEAMTLGHRTSHEPAAIGKYGMGLKSASFSQADSVTVLTRRGPSLAARRWTTEGIARGWRCDLVDESDARGFLSEDWGPVRTDPSGTVVFWERLSQFTSTPDYLDKKIQDLYGELATHLGLAFHRFLASGSIRIAMDTVNIETGVFGPPRQVLPLDPFDYPSTGSPGYPKPFELHLGQFGSLTLMAHIWPKATRLPGYRLGGGQVARRQGFYFYRNDRLIQAGGWNGYRKDTEPHGSLARVSVDLPAAFDDAFHISMQKASINVPGVFLTALKTVSSLDGVTFQSYLEKAEQVYRRAAPSPAPVPQVLGGGMPKSLRTRFQRILAPQRRARQVVRIEWRPLDGKHFFELDRDSDTIYINGRFRAALLDGLPHSASDAPVLKTFLFLLLREELDRERKSERGEEFLKECQAMLYEAARHQEEVQRRRD